MVFDLNLIQKVYSSYPARVAKARLQLNRPLTYAEKILYSHLFDSELQNFVRGKEYANFSPDRVAMQDATAQMALLQFMIAGKDEVAVPASVHCDHLILAENNASEDLKKAISSNEEVYRFLQSVSNKYGIGFWKPGAGIIHQVVLENYAFPGGMMVGTDSHTPNAGGLGMIAIGVGGADAVDVLTHIPWELKMPLIIGVKLTGKLSGWCSPKDIILKLAGLLTVKGATNAIIEYFGDGTLSISATGKATICNMGAEVGATTSLFPYDCHMKQYLIATGRNEVALAADQIEDCLKADEEVLKEPERFYDQIIEIDLSSLEPYINGPFTPDAAHPISELAQVVRENDYPQKMEVGLIGSCTNSSYEDLSRAASVARQAVELEIEPKAAFLVNPGSEQILQTADRNGLINDFKAIGGIIMANACGPCIGQWNRKTTDNTRRNSIVTSFNRNFAKRADGNANTFAFVASPEIVTALTLAGDLCFNPLTDFLTNRKGEQVKLAAPWGDDLPLNGFTTEECGYVAPSVSGKEIAIEIALSSERLQSLIPFAQFSALDFASMVLLIKAQGKCTTDHISMAGKWLRYRGHLENISNNLLMGAVNFFNGKTNEVLNPVTLKYDTVSSVAKDLKSNGISSVVIAEENYGEGSSREHAALEPRFLNVKVVICKSFARIHETNLKKQGVLALTFVNKADYDKIREDDTLSIGDVAGISPGKQLTVELKHNDGITEHILAQHSYNELQIDWFRAGSALNYMANKTN